MTRPEHIEMHADYQHDARNHLGCGCLVCMIEYHRVLCWRNLDGDPVDWAEVSRPCERPPLAELDGGLARAIAEWVHHDAVRRCLEHRAWREPELRGRGLLALSDEDYDLPF